MDQSLKGSTLPLLLLVWLPFSLLLAWHTTWGQRAKRVMKVKGGSKCFIPAGGLDYFRRSVTERASAGRIPFGFEGCRVSCTQVAALLNIHQSPDGEAKLAWLRAYLELEPEARWQMQASHLCNIPGCIEIKHLIFEDYLANLSRIGCPPGSFTCPFCANELALCRHSPPCLHAEQMREEEEAAGKPKAQEPGGPKQAVSAAASKPAAASKSQPPRSSASPGSKSPP